MKKRSLVLGAVCGLALVGAGCGDDDNDTLSYDDTGTELGSICESVNDASDGLNGKPENDAPILESFAAEFEDAVQQVRDLDVHEELEADRDAFADNADQQIAVIKEAQAAAEEGNAKKYRSTLEQGSKLGEESNEIASRLGATGCIS